MTLDSRLSKFTVGKTKFCQSANHARPLFRVEPDIPCEHARELASELMDCVCHMTMAGVLEGSSQLVWASHYLSALAKALLDDAELGMMH